MKICEYCHQIDKHDYRCPNYEPKQSSYICCECNERINIGEEYIKNDNDEYMHYDCIPGNRKFAKWLGYEIEEMEENANE